MVNKPPLTQLSLLEKLHLETAKMSWLELQPFFAKGSVLIIDQSLDLIQIAVDFAEDHTEKLSVPIEQKLIAAPTNDLARQWYDQKECLWTVVVSPFVLVQEIKK